jgi:hypothetical protein
MSANGDFAVVWNHYFSESHFIPQGIFVRHFDRQGRPTHSTEIQLDADDGGEPSNARIVALPDSGYFVAWFGSRGSASGLVGRFLDPAGRPRGPALLLRRNAWPVALAVVSDSLLVAWQEGFEGILRARRFDLAGRPLGKVIRLTHRRTTGLVGLAPLSDSFVAVWQGSTRRSWILEAQRFSLAGEPLGAALRVNESPLQGQFGAQVASDGNDRFAVAWTTTNLRSDPKTGQQFLDDETRARFFDAGGANGPETHPNQLFTGNQQATGLAMDGRGLALVTWNSDRNSPASSLDVVGRFLDPGGQPASKAIPLSQNLEGTDFCPAAATSGSDEWVVVWLKQHMGLFARRLAFEN